ncbi:MAG: TauD/TfdA family dioxygenase [Alphaproteobacteria bacterium]|nr:TauD/TfdA family dioxygenase [Alphaproteobacteria bacterium]
MEIQPVTAIIGAEIVGADLENLTDAQFATIEQAFTDHLVVFFRDQPPLSSRAHIAFGKRFGKPHIHPIAPGPEGHPEIMIIQADANSRYADGNNWHTDVSCDIEPPLGSCLQLRVLPPVGGDTLFANMYAAYETLSPMMQDFLADKTAMHESEHVYRGRYSERGVDDTGKVYPSAEHPVVRTHPRSGRQALYVNPSFTTKINGLTKAESKAVLQLLYVHQQRPEFQVRFQWSENAIAFWDNRCTQHFAIWDYWPDERMGHRVTVKGERPFHEDRDSVQSDLRVSRRHD